MKEKGWLKEQLEYSKNATKDWPVWRKEALDLSVEDSEYKKYLRYADKVVSAWPKWKKDSLGSA